MSMEYIRTAYNVPAKRGGRITYLGMPYTIVGSKGQYLLARADGHGQRRVLTLHPTWGIDYYDGAGAHASGSATC